MGTSGGAHLHRLRAHSLRFMSCFTQRMQAGSGLRPLEYRLALWFCLLCFCGGCAICCSAGASQLRRAGAPKQEPIEKYYKVIKKN